jgi:hypothetical protein
MKRGKAPELPLETSVPGADTSIAQDEEFVLTSNFTLPILLARGILFAPAAGESSQLDFLDSWGANLPLHPRAIPRNWVAELEGSARNAFPIALCVRNDAGGLAFGPEGAPTHIAYLKLADVRQFVFRNDEERERFFSWTFENVPEFIARERCVVDSPKFQGEVEVKASTPELSGAPTAAPTVPDSAPALRRSDALAALLAVVLVHGVSLKEWFGALNKLTSVDWVSSDARKPWLIQLIASLASTTPVIFEDLDSALLGSTVAVMLRHTYELGWPAEQILDEIQSAARSGVSSGGAERADQDLDAWVKHCRNIVAAKAEPPVLSDEKSIVRRAILLLLMRGGIQELVEASVQNRAATVVVGPLVRMLALGLAAIRTGFRAMPREYKVMASVDGPQDMRQGLADLFVADFHLRVSGVQWHFPTSVEIEYRRQETSDADWIVRFGTATPITLRASVNTILRTLATRAKSLGFEVRDEDGELLRLTPTGDDSALLPVHAAASANKTNEPPVIRVWSEVPVYKGGPKPSSRKRKPKSVSSMPKEFFLDLLKEQFRGDARIAFAVSEDGEKLYLVSEIVATAGDAQLRTRMLEMSRRATRYSSL